MKLLAKKLEKVAKKAALTILRRFLSAARETPIADLSNVSRVLVIRPNYRIGNAILSTAIIGPLRERFPEASIDILATDKTATLFRNLPVNRVFAASRSSYIRPWRAAAMLRLLRANRYDLAVQLAGSSFSGLLIAMLVRARYVMGKSKGDEPLYDINVIDHSNHAYDLCTAFSLALGTVSPTKTQLITSDEEVEYAVRSLQAVGLTANTQGKVEPFIAVFVGGHANKVCPLQFWIALMRGLDKMGKRFVTFVGPEETSSIPELQKALGTMKHGVLCPLQTVRVFAAMLAQAQFMVTPDSGPMHMAAALDVPVVMIARVQKSLEFLPPGTRNSIIWDLDVGQALLTVCGKGQE